MCRFHLFALSCVTALASVASADTVTVTLDAVTIPVGVVCNDTWMESGVTLSFVAKTPDDCATGSCSFGIFPDSVALFPARLNLDVSGLGGQIKSAEADVIDGCSFNCTRLLLYNGANLVATTGNTLTGVLETLSASGGGTPIDRIAVSSCEGSVFEIRIEVNPVGDCSNSPCGNNGNKVLLCHVPPGNPDNAHTICISPNALAAHLQNHEGDHCGPCTPVGLSGDLDGDGIVGMVDFLALLKAWDSCSDCGACPADFDGDCSIGVLDLLILLENWTA